MLDDRDERDDVTVVTPQSGMRLAVRRKAIFSMAPEREPECPASSRRHDRHVVTAFPKRGQ